MSPHTIATLVSLGLLALVAVCVLARCVVGRRRIWTAATKGRYLPVVAYLATSTALGVVLFNTAFDPPWPISWNEPIRCAQDCGWQYYYVLVVISLMWLTLAAVAAVTALLFVLLKAIIVGYSGENSNHTRDSHV